ncbi:MAG TPA: lactonase family protein [Opitutaceae bacterium]|nr:lactonase family protein [Opitutaceae bacterium]
MKETLVYVGTYTGARTKSQGIYVFRLQTQDLEVSQNIMLVPLGLAAESPNPAFLAVDAQRRLVFAINEQDAFEGKSGGGVSAFAIDPATGKLKPINTQSSGGTGPCHLVLDRTGKNVLVANYSGGSVSVLPVAADGRLGEAKSVIKHSGRSVNPQRQEAPHAHCVTLDPTNKFAFVCDLGIDQIVAYRFDADKGTLAPANPPYTSSKPGAGPRHMVFRPDGKFAYVINELNSTVTAYAHDGNGKLTELHTESSLPPYFDGKNSGAEIGMHPSGKWLYVSNRGNNTVILFDIDKEKGRISYTEEQGTGGKTPRHFGIQPSGKHLAIANQDSNTVLVCRIDDGNGRLKPSGVFADVPAPVCVVFVPPAGETMSPKRMP